MNGSSPSPDDETMDTPPEESQTPPDQQPITVTIAKGSPAAPSDGEQLQIGDDVCLYGKVTANDGSGLTVEVNRSEKMAAEEEPGSGGETEPDSMAGADEGTPAATDYVRKMRRGGKKSMAAEMA